MILFKSYFNTTLGCAATTRNHLETLTLIASPRSIRYFCLPHPHTDLD